MSDSVPPPLPSPPSPPSPPAPRFYRSLYFRVIVAIALGVAVGVLAPSVAVELRPLGEGFIKLVKMTIAPLIFCTIVVGIAGMKSMKAVGKTGGLALLYFELMSTLALVIGLVVVNLVGPGRGMNIDPSTLDTSGIAKYTSVQPRSTTEFLLDIIPDAFVSAFAKGELLPVLLISILFGFALHATGERGKPVFELIDRFGQVVFGIVNLIMKAAPVGAFGAMAYTVGAFGVSTLVSLGELMACFYGTCLLFVFGVLGIVARLHGFRIVKFVRYIREELFIVFGTSSSESALPRMIAKLERLGAGKPTVGLVIPTGYSFNLDGTSIYLTMAAMFVAQATNTDLSLTQQLGLLGVLLLTSKGAAGVTGSGFIVLAATLVGHVPVAGLAIILGIDRFMSEARALTNVIGNGVATIVVAKWCGDLDEQTLHDQLDRGVRSTDDVIVFDQS
ncbi:MAG: dicarboxylate/amino acid:cation symporter [Proteobacteria bacterium]|nr:dicarboxylate/amino acid:cation symporter [Pseudomonadota bacterium]